MAEHTPGKWFVDYDTGGYPHVRPELEPGYSIAVVITCINMPYEEVQANARLIAAAPELLAACERLLYADATPDRSGVLVNMPGAFEQIREAVRLATAVRPELQDEIQGE